MPDAHPAGAEPPVAPRSRDGCVEVNPVDEAGQGHDLRRTAAGTEPPPRPSPNDAAHPDPDAAAPRHAWPARHVSPRLTNGSARSRKLRVFPAREEVTLERNISDGDIPAREEAQSAPGERGSSKCSPRSHGTSTSFMSGERAAKPVCNLAVTGQLFTPMSLGSDCASRTPSGISTKLEYLTMPCTKYKEDLQIQFDAAAKDADGLDEDEFLTMAGVTGAADVEFGRMLFGAIDVKNSGKVKKAAFVNAMVRLNFGPPVERLKQVFRIYDNDRRGRINRSQFKNVLELSLTCAKLSMDAEELDQLVDSFFRTVDLHDDDHIDFSDLKACLGKHPDIGRHFEFHLPSVPRELTSSGTAGRRTLLLQAIENNFQRVATCAVLGGAGVALFVAGWAKNSEGPLYDLLGCGLPLAKGCAEVIKLASMLLLLPVCRGLMSSMRDAPFFRHVLPFDDLILAHRTLGQAVLVFAIIHVASHLVNFAFWSDAANFALWRAAFPDAAGHPAQPSYARLCTSWTGLTGIYMCACFLIAMPFAFHWPRRAAWLAKYSPKSAKYLNDFNRFMFTHYILVTFYIALVAHPLPSILSRASRGTTIYWVLVPVLIYVAERARRRMNEALGYRSQILDARLLPGKVLMLLLRKPRGWKAKAGAYIFVNVPEVALFEWHPFSISSGPGAPHVSVHIRSLGDWTGALHERIQDVLKDRVAEDGSGARPATGLAAAKKVPDFPRISIEGPCGAPAQDYDRYQVLMLVCGGIGFTPMASILEDCLYKIKQAKCRHCGRNTGQAMIAKKIYMIAMVRTPPEGAWFKEHLEDILKIDDEDVVEFNLHITSAEDAQDARTGMLELARRVHHSETDGVDPISKMSTKTLSKLGRPRWDAYFDQVRERHPMTNVGVFFCGPPAVAKKLSTLAASKSSDLDTRFHFHCERF